MIAIENLSFSYQTKSLFKKINLTLEEGKIYGLLGKNGSGKTTLFKLLSGILFAQEGSIKISDTDPTKRAKMLYEHLFFYPEEINVPDMKVYDFAKFYSPLYKNWDQEKFDSLLDSMQIPRDFSISKLSLGMQKKFFLAFALASNALVNLLDEPTVGLDIPSKRDFRKTIINDLTQNKIFIISSHQVKDFNKLLDEIIIIDKGRILFQCSMEKLENNLGISYIQGNLDPESPDILYSEEAVGGYICLIHKKDQSMNYQELDLEVFFNAVISDAAKIKKILEIQ